ncbi:hypothetical protein SAY86_013131 [Trapa natans]|uniref:Uncharacterized protein n=1 Tax=Trapa natans TaxID=22666 RepID=A0AAN7R9U4_TRANT|nr:hypothetical protein SAY86_013131 [Trapa natans]
MVVVLSPSSFISGSSHLKSSGRKLIRSTLPPEDQSKAGRCRSCKMPSDEDEDEEEEEAETEHGWMAAGVPLRSIGGDSSVARWLLAVGIGAALSMSSSFLSSVVAEEEEEDGSTARTTKLSLVILFYGGLVFWDDWII